MLILPLSLSIRQQLERKRFDQQPFGIQHLSIVSSMYVFVGRRFSWSVVISDKIYFFPFSLRFFLYKINESYNVRAIFLTWTSMDQTM